MGNRKVVAGGELYVQELSATQNHPWIMTEIKGALTPTLLEQLNLPSGLQVQIPKCEFVFKEWKGEPIKDTYNNKPVIDYDGRPLFAELATLKMFQKEGWSGVWVDSYRNKYRVGLPEECTHVELPAEHQRFINAVREQTKTRGGCWDLLLWRNGVYKFVELKRTKEDKLRPNQYSWLEKTLELGYEPNSFLIVEWSLMI